MRVNLSHRYPRVMQLRDGSQVTVRPMSRADESALVEFFQGIRARERFFLKDDVTSRNVIRGWIENLDFSYAIPLLAFDGHNVAGNAVLIRHRSASLAHAGEIRVVIAPDSRDRGLAVTLMNELVEVAREAGLREVLFECVAGIQELAIHAAEYLGAEVAGDLKAWVRDDQDQGHDVVFLRLKL